ncbi:MAG: hypothetical protein K0B09_11185 [Bacteroidales bacterium]|nr:hypothetical protein [Bacteroidales bacterium]
MNQLFRFFLVAFFALGVWSCVTTAPTGKQTEPQEPIEKVFIATNLSDSSVVSFLGITIFENKRTYIADYDFSLNHFVKTQVDSTLISKGLTTIVSENPLPEETMRGLRSGSRSVRVTTAKSLHSIGADAMLLIEQGQARTGLNYNHGYLLPDHGLFLVRTIAGRRDFVKVPIIIRYYDLRTGEMIRRVVFDDDQMAESLTNFNHITEADHLKEADRAALTEAYKTKVDSLLRFAFQQLQF